MKRYEDGDKVQEGTYMNVKTGELISIPSDDGTLPDAGKSGFVRVPILVVLVAGPILGLAYIIFLPLAGLGSLVMLAFHRIFAGKLESAEQESRG